MGKASLIARNIHSLPWKHLLVELVQSLQKLPVSEEPTQESRSSTTIPLKEYLMDIQGCN